MRGHACWLMVVVGLLGCSDLRDGDKKSANKQALYSVSLDIEPSDPIFVGAYRRVAVVIDPGSGLHYEDLDFIVLEGPEGGVVSRSKDSAFNPSDPHVLIGAGYAPGEYNIDIIDTSSNVVGGAKFVVTDAPYLGQPDDGAFWFTGISKPAGLGAAWGGGSSTMPENYAVRPRIGQHDVAVILIDTNDAPYTPTESTDTLTYFEQALKSGVSVGSDTVSIKSYIEEVSEKRYSVGTVTTFGPYHLNGDLLDFFIPDMLEGRMVAFQRS